MVKEQTELLWAVVKVESGIPVMVEAYRDRQSAEMREQSLRKDMHPENDETGVFEIQYRRRHSFDRELRDTTYTVTMPKDIAALVVIPKERRH